MDVKKSTHGGPGRNQGRHPLADEPTERVTITLLKSQLQWLREVGEGNVSLAVRKLVAAFLEIERNE